MEVPPDRLAKETLRALIVEFVSRDGTDYGEQEQSEETKVRQVEALIRRGEVVIVFDEKSETCNLMTRDEARRIARANEG